MRCIFCKQNSSNSHSVEHIIPESLGNLDYVLPCGVVCDKCNNYIAREIEKPILDSTYFREHRFRTGLQNKRGRIPHLDGIHLETLTHIQMAKSRDEQNPSISSVSPQTEPEWINTLVQQGRGTLIFPVGNKPNDYVFSRLIAKIGLEVLAFRLLNIQGGLDEIVDKPELDELRNYVRRGSPNKVWPYSFRQLYEPNFLFKDGDNFYELLHEFDILITPKNEFYIVVVIFGEEYALNLGEREIRGYFEWLELNNGQSPLYCGKNG